MSVGRPSDFTHELALQIRALVLEGKKYKEIQEELDILPTTWDAWVHRDYKDFRKNLNSWKFERLIKKSEKLSEEILDLKHTQEKDGKTTANDKILRIQQKEAEFVRSTLAKEFYSTRVESTGADGQPIQFFLNPELATKNEIKINDADPETD